LYSLYSLILIKQKKQKLNLKQIYLTNSNLFNNQLITTNTNKTYFNYLYLTNFQNFQKYSHYTNYKFFNTYYLQKILNIKVEERNINTINILPQKILKKTIFGKKNISMLSFNIKYFNFILHMFLLNVWLKNIVNICKYIKKNLESVHYKKHKSYFLFYCEIFEFYIFKFADDLKIKGISIVFRGKLGQGGNSRKKALFFKKGYCSLGKKSLAVNSNKFSIWTKSGSVGCQIQLFF